MDDNKPIGHTPLVRIGEICFKCEYENPTGSHKDRAFSGRIDKLVRQGVKRAVISSSGNAAISAANFCLQAGIRLTVFVSPRINREKLARLKELRCSIITSDRPLSASIKFAKENNAFNLRQSTDPMASIGYEDIAHEIINEGIIPDAVFIPVSSGATIVGMASGFGKFKYNIPMHAVQTDTIHPVAGVFDKDFKKSNVRSFSDAIVARFTPLEERIIEIIRNTNGSGWVISNEQMKAGRMFLLSHDLNCSYEGAAALAAYWKAKEKGWNIKKPVCLLTGKYYA